MIAVSIAPATAAPVLHGGETVGSFPFPHWALLILSVFALWAVVVLGVRAADGLLARAGL